MFKTIWKLFRQPRNFQETSLIYQISSGYNIQNSVQKLSGRAKTFRGAMLPRSLLISVSETQRVLTPHMSGYQMEPIRDNKDFKGGVRNVKKMAEKRKRMVIFKETAVLTNYLNFMKSSLHRFSDWSKQVLVGGICLGERRIQSGKKFKSFSKGTLNKLGSKKFFITVIL